MNPFFIICERDAGLFSLIQQVIANLPRALNAESIPVVYFGVNCCYWVPSGYKNQYNVWQYYFEPLLAKFSSDSISEEVKAFANHAFEDGGTIGISYDHHHFLTNNYGDHSCLRHKCLSIPFEWNDPDDWLRAVSSRLISTFIRPRKYLVDRANIFENGYFRGSPIIGVHIRGTDALSEEEPRLFRKNSLLIERYLVCLDREKRRQPNAKIFVATDSLSSLRAIQQAYGSDVLNCSTILHDEGRAAGKGPTGALMPAYIANNAQVAAENGAEAVVDYLLLRRCRILIHNGASLARTVLLSEPDLPHFNTHQKTLNATVKSISLRPRSVLQWLQKWDERLHRNRKVDFEKWIDFISRI
jgi:hypothetical protein